MFDTLQFAFQRAGIESVAQADLEPLDACRLDHEIDCAGAHRGNDIVDAAVRGLHDHRHIDRSLAQPRQNTEPVEVRHNQIEDHTIDARAVDARKQPERGVAIIQRHRLVTGFLQHAFEKPALHGIVVDDQNTPTHN